jgi:hypothetical protein
MAFNTAGLALDPAFVGVRERLQPQAEYGTIRDLGQFHRVQLRWISRVGRPALVRSVDGNHRNELGPDVGRFELGHCPVVEQVTPVGPPERGSGSFQPSRMRALWVDLTPDGGAEVSSGERGTVLVEKRQALVLLVLCQVLVFQWNQLGSALTAQTYLGLEHVVRRGGVV